MCTEASGSQYFQHDFETSQLGYLVMALNLEPMAIANAAKLFLESLESVQPDHVFLKLYFRNAFNLLHR